jgi:hypothetical protein
MQPRLDNEKEIPSKTAMAAIGDTGASTLDEVSLAAVIQILLQRGICTEAELLTEESRLRLLQETTPRAAFTPAQIPREHHHQHDHKLLRRWAAKYSWSRKLGTLIFGWKWHRKKRI